jgi:hypothetical protein
MQPDSIAWPRDVHNLAIDENLTTIGVNQSIEDIHQGSFAGSVFPNQCMNLTLTHLEIDMVVGNDTGPGFGNVAHLYGRGCRDFLGWSQSCTFLHR